MGNRISSKESTAALFNRYVWLAELIYHAERISFEEISQRWERSRLNELGGPLPLRTFHNHRKAIEEIFDIIIECEKGGKYRYYIENSDDIEYDSVRSWLLNTLSVRNIISESRDLQERILFEYIPSGQKHLMPIIEAMRSNRVLKFEYHPFVHNPFTTTLHPYFVKVFRQRWYVIGYNPFLDAMRIYSLDRINVLETIDESFVMPTDFSPQNYFRHSYGIDRGEEPQRVVLRVSEAQANYLRSLPLHHTQKEEEGNENYAVFSYYLSPDSYDFRQYLISLMGEVEVVEPQSLREEMKQTLIDTLKNYEDD